jgi:hypothetical protein
VTSSTIHRVDISSVDVILKLKNETVQKVHLECLFKDTGEDGKGDINGHNGRFHAACDDKGATMTVVKVQGSNGEEFMAAGYIQKLPILKDSLFRSILQLRP